MKIPGNRCYDSSRNATNFNYDYVGNTLQRSGNLVANGSQGFGYNEFNMPYVVHGGATGSDDVSIEYNADNTRIAKRGPTQTTLYAGDLYECVGTTPGVGATLQCNEQRFKISNGSKLVTVVTRDTFNNDAAKYVQSDFLGSSTLVTDATGAVAESRTFGPFGATTSDFSTTPVRAGYTGQEEDPELGLVNMGGRLYDANVARFLTPDPLVAQPFDPLGLNRFSYALNNPLRFTDPTGYSTCDADGVGCYTPDPDPNQTPVEPGPAPEQPKQ